MNPGFARLDPLFRPGSVAIVGASATAGGVGDRVLANLRSGGYGGRIALVNPRYDRIGTLPCHPTIAAVPHPVDCAVLAVPATGVVAVVEQAAAAGVRAAVVLAAGFKETGEADGHRWERALAALAADAGIAVLGPNCLGLINGVTGTALTFAPGLGEVTGRMGGAPGLAVVSQSGGLGSFLLHACERGVSFSHFVSTGNSAALDVGDAVGYLAADPMVTGFCLTYEGLRVGTRLLEALELARSLGKPVVAVKSGRSRSGGAAAVSHTGSAVGNGAASVAALEARSVLVVDAIDELLEPAAFLAKVRDRRPTRDGVAVATGSGGAAVLACDSAERWGVRLARFSASTVEQIGRRLPSYVSVTNPVDVTASASLGGVDPLAVVLEEAAGDDDVGALVVPLGVAFAEAGSSGDRAAAMDALASRIDIPLAVVWLSQAWESPGALLLERSPRVGIFRSMSLCFRTIAHHLASRSSGAERDERAERPDGPEASAGARRSGGPEPIGRLRAPIPPRALAAATRVQELRDRGRSGALDEVTSCELLESAGVPLVARRRCRDRQELAAALEDWTAYPAVLKVVSADLPHKSKVGGVRTFLPDSAAVSAAAEEITTAVSRAAPEARLDGLLLAQMIDGSAEILVGGFRDSVYGPVVAVGPGGIGAGARTEITVAVAPLPLAAARDRVTAAPGLSALPAAVTGEVAAVLVAVGDLLAAAPSISEIDVNPLIVTRDGRCLAVDGLVTIRSEGLVS